MQAEPAEELPMSRCSPELTLKDALSDSIVKAVMAADRVDPREFEANLRDIAKMRAEAAPERHCDCR
jgi:hypothetical protein